LGILAVTAVPKFINLQDDAKRATADGVAAAMKGASQMVYAKALINSEEAQNPGSVTIQSVGSVTTRYGYPTADAAGIGAVVEVDSPWAPAASQATGTYTYEYNRDTACTVTYTQAATSAATATAVANCG